MLVDGGGSRSQYVGWDEMQSCKGRFPGNFWSWSARAISCLCIPCTTVHVLRTTSTGLPPSLSWKIPRSQWLAWIDSRAGAMDHLSSSIKRVENRKYLFRTGRCPKSPLLGQTPTYSSTEVPKSCTFYAPFYAQCGCLRTRLQKAAEFSDNIRTADVVDAHNLSESTFQNGVF